MTAADSPSVSPMERLLAQFDTMTASDLAKNFPQASPQPESILPVSAASIQAAISDYFMPGAIHPSGQATDALVRHAAPVIVDGVSRLRLTDQARADVLCAALRDLATKAYLHKHIALLTADNVPDAPVSKWIRRFLAGEAVKLTNAPPHELRAAVDALERLWEVPPDLVPRPAAAEARRALERAELLEPLRLLVGTEGGWDGSPVTDQFVGRVQQQHDLRAYVDAIASHGALEAISRYGNRTLQSLGLADAGIVVIEASGGLGKSALMAKFVLDHAMDQVDPFPFVYLDFDRSALQPREPRHLLAETLRQLSLQFGEHAEPLLALRDQLLGELQGALTRGEPFAACRALLTDLLGVGRRPFLLVLDTLEVAQYEPVAIDGIDRFVEAMAGPTGLPGLRVVAAGRAGLGNMGFLSAIKGPVHPIVLGALSVTEAIEMANKRGAAVLGNAWNERWATCIVGLDREAREEAERREPLSVRVAVDAVAHTEPAKRAQLAEKMAKHGFAADSSFVGRLYEQRVLAHVNKDAVKLAWPGLIVRNVTVEIVRDLLAGVIGMKPEEAQAAFDSLAREVWIVEGASQDGTKVLRHKRELRAKTLPLMRLQEDNKFDEVNRAAIGYFGLFRDAASHAEWIYHRLLDDQEPAVVDADWTPDDARRLADAVNDFPRSSPQRLYLLGQTAQALLPADTLMKLPDWQALEHLARTAADHGGFDDVRTLPEILPLTRQSPSKPLSKEAAAVRAALLIKAGIWDDALPDPADIANPAWAERARFARSYREARRPPPSPDLSTVAALPDMAGPNQYSWLAQDLAAARRLRPHLFETLDDELAAHLDDVRSLPQRCDLASLRVAAIFGEKSCLPAARLWSAASRQTLSRDQMLTMSGAEAEILTSGDFDIAEFAEPQDRDLIVERLQLLTKSRQSKIRLADAEFDGALQRTLGHLAVSVAPNIDILVTRYFAQRQPDWIVPLAYAAAAALDDKPAAARRVATYVNAYQPKKLFSSAHLIHASNPLDMVEVMRLADEASDLRGMAAEILDLAPHSPAADRLHTLIKDFDDWRAAISTVVAADMPQDRSREDWAPSPPAITVEDDPQKNRWGGKPERDGRRLGVTLTGESKSLFNIDIFVDSTDGTELVGPVIFHLHSTYPRSVIRINRVRNSRATLFQVVSYGMFTIGAQVKRANGAWTQLELDLLDVPGIPDCFLDK